MSTTTLSPSQRKTLGAFRRRLIMLGLISSAIDMAIFTVEFGWIVATFGGSLVVDELIEWVISSLLAKNKMRLKKRYKIAGFIPVPGITSLSIQAVVEMIASFRKPEQILERLEEDAE